MRVLIVGSGAREHAIAWKMSLSPLHPEILTAPGNAGTAGLGANYAVDPEDLDGLLALATGRSVDLTFIGPEAPLAAGVVDRFEAAGLRVFGPTGDAARIESSKAFAKQVMDAAGVATAASRTFSDIDEAVEYVDSVDGPLVVKADGLAAGKGVIMAPTRSDAIAALHSMFIDRSFGAAADTVLVEEWLKGTETSVFAFVDGDHVSEMTAACDYKRAYDGDAGPNTGGMGSFSPPTFWDAGLESTVRSEIMEPVAAQMVKLGCPFRGILYAGLMLTTEGPKVLEFNCRLGDPEAQVVLPRLESDLLGIILSATDGRLSQQQVRWSDDRWVGVVLASAGYPGDYQTGFEITGLPRQEEGMVVFHAGTRLNVSNGSSGIFSSGGRVLTAAAKGETLAAARRRTYDLAGSIRFVNAFCRSDIAADQ